jgi:hypothetical protein
MTRKGKDKVPRIAPEFQAAFDAEAGLVQQQLTEHERKNLAKLAPDTAALFRDRTDEYDARVDEARQSENRLPDDEWKDLDPEPALVKVLTAEQLDAVLDAPEPAKVLCAWCGLEVAPMWMQRASQMAKAKGVGVTEFMTELIKRQWVASGAGKAKR